ncbi:MAG: class B sortase [Bacillota bacterium]|nr:class B sortase [Bacillota bacterium]
MKQNIENKNEFQNVKTNKTSFIVFIVAILGCIIAASIIVWNLYTQYQAGRENTISSLPTICATIPKSGGNTSSKTTTVIDGVDFTALQKINPDICAYIKIPNTHVNYPVTYAVGGNINFYLDHNYKKQYEFAGCIYIEANNKRNFSDPNTVLYGHDMLNLSMFGSLSYFRTDKFFNSNPYIYVYIPGHKLTYKIFSAYDYDNRHILNSFDFSNKEVYQKYLNYATNPTDASNVHKRNIKVTTNDKIITLSTCFHNIESRRYLVQGVLIKDEQY